MTPNIDALTIKRIDFPRVIDRCGSCYGVGRVSSIYGGGDELCLLCNGNKQTTREMTVDEKIAYAVQHSNPTSQPTCEDKKNER